MKYTTPFVSTANFAPPQRKKTVKKRKGYLRLHEEMRIKYSPTTDILPFSLHYNIFRRPKNLDLNVG